MGELMTHPLHRPFDDPGAALPTIETRDLSKSFGAVEVLKSVSFQACEHQVVSIIGASGSGKSTFLRCLNFLEQPSAGEIRFKGESLHIGGAAGARQKDIERLRRRTGMVFQQFNLWSHWTVMENIVKVPIHVHGVSRQLAEERAIELLAKVGLAGKKDAYPSALSGGQQQRVAIARALAVDPELLLFDEPTSALDPELVGEVLAVIRSLATDGRTMIVVTHEMGFAREVSDKVVFFHNGRIEEEGAPGEILKRPQSPRLATFLSSVR
jgi:ABC-type histidine transport system ATPase subunit